MAIELRLCEPVHVPVLLRALGSWRWGPATPAVDGAAASSLLRLTRSPALGSVWLVEHRGSLVGYVVVEMCASRGFLWREARVTALFLAPEARRAGVGRVVRRVLGGLLLGSGIGLVSEGVTPDDRHWAGLAGPPAVPPVAPSVAA